MKRFIYVPHFLIGNDLEIPEEAKKLAKDAQLSIRTGLVGDGINKNSVCIISIPEVASSNMDDIVKSGHIFSVDITNEFVEMGKDIIMETVSPMGKKEQHKPSMLERHVAKFRTRFDEVGKYEVIVFNNNEKFLVSSFEVV